MNVVARASSISWSQRKRAPRRSRRFRLPRSTLPHLSSSAALKTSDASPDPRACATNADLPMASLRCRLLRPLPIIHVVNADRLIGLERALEIEFLCHFADSGEHLGSEQADT